MVNMGNYLLALSFLHDAKHLIGNADLYINDDTKSIKAKEFIGSAISILERELSEGLTTVEKCQWRISDPYEMEYYDTSCGEAFVFTVGGIAENNCNFCSFCGGQIEDVSEYDDD